MVLSSLAACRKGSSPSAHLLLDGGDGLVQRVDVAQVQLEHEAVVRADAAAQRFEQLGAAGLDARGRRTRPATRGRCGRR